jgi:hypothetical protein
VASLSTSLNLIAVLLKEYSLGGTLYCKQDDWRASA